MKYFAKNIAFLREKKGLKQDEMQRELGIKRTTWNGYELGTSKPYLDVFSTIAKYFDINEYDLLNTDMSEVGNLITTEQRPEFGKPRNLKGNLKGNLTSKKSDAKVTDPVLPLEVSHLRMPQVITVDTEGNENVIMVPVRARAGYLNGYSDPEFIGKLPAYRLPGLNIGSFRLFEVEGLSMYPTLHGGDLVIGSFVEQLRDLRDDRVYVVVTKNEGVVVKRILNRISKDGKIILKSDNYKDRDMYPSIVCDPEDIVEVWYATGYISRQMRPPSETYNRVVDVEGRLTLLEELLKKGVLKTP